MSTPIKTRSRSCSRTEKHGLFGEQASTTRSCFSCLSRHLEGIAVGEVRIGGCHRQDDGVGIGDILHAHRADLVLDVRRLIPSSHLRQNNGARQDMRRTGRRGVGTVGSCLVSRGQTIKRRCQSLNAGRQTSNHRPFELPYDATLVLPSRPSTFI